MVKEEDIVLYATIALFMALICLVVYIGIIRENK